MGLTFAVAIAAMIGERLSWTQQPIEFRSVHEFTGAASEPPNKDFYLKFLVTDPLHENPIEVYAASEFGFDPLLSFDISPSNLNALEIKVVNLRYRYRKFFWIPAESWESQLRKKYGEIHFFPTGH